MLANPIPDFELESTEGKPFRLTDYRGKKLIIYFYPKDDTPGCTTESQQFSHLYEQFKALNCEVVGISRDSIKSHENFREKLGLPFDLLSDSNETVCSRFEVMKLKNMYGKQVRGIERSTFVIDEQGKLIREWRGVKVPGHVDEVLSFIKTL
ncbi:MAG TPA: peroxiredoxin [Nitrosomonas sp.]|nr:peroxiredoxin [Nitrosomonas sp.]HMW19674.1 peroxiredoxin [Nitrosomonas sp.]HMW67978.1 peroxiredoxin [Nitrosomonas sp.]HMY60441.1 peroxiredoxin [Nitrosomonas sp.]HMY89393.1 peroxiredoxin [Nitrosomonas sp.]